MRRFRVESKDRNAVEVEVGETERGFQHAPIHGLVFAERLHLNWQRGGQPAHPVEAGCIDPLGGAAVLQSGRCSDTS